MLEAGGQPSTETGERIQPTLMCPLTVGGRLLGVDLGLVREFRPNPDTSGIDVVLRIDDEVITLGVDGVGLPLEFDQIGSAGVELISPAQLLPS